MKLSNILATSEWFSNATKLYEFYPLTSFAVCRVCVDFFWLRMPLNNRCSCLKRVLNISIQTNSLFVNKVRVTKKW